MEELENEISTQAEENTVSLASAQALADALAKIEVYTPTTWVDNSSPDIDAEHLNKPEQAIKRVTDALNSAVDVIKDLQSQVTKNSRDISDVNNNLSNNLYKAAYTDDIFITTERPMFVYWDGNTKNTPYKSGLTSCTEGFAFSYGAWAGYMTVVCFVKNDSTMWIWSKSRNAWVEYAAKSDLEPVKSRQINTYTSANKDTDATLSSYESKTENFILLFTSNDTTGTIPTLTGSHLFVIEHLLVGDDSASAIERAYSTKGKLIAWRFKQWWNKTWTAWENS